MSVIRLETRGNFRGAKPGGFACRVPSLWNHG